MFALIEILMLMTGVLALVTGKIPSFLIGGAKYRFEGRGVRLLGALLVLPLPLAFVGGFVLGLLLGAEAEMYAILLEMAIIVVTLIGVLVLGRRVRQPVMAATAAGGGLEPEALVAKKSQGALIYALMGIAGFSAIVACPLAFARAGQALRLMEEHGVGEEHRNTARLARVLAAAILLFYVVAALGILGLYWLA